MNLVEFLSARLDEDADHPGCEGWAEYTGCEVLTAHVCAIAQANRRILDLITFPSGGIREPFGPEQAAVVRIMAEVYADHPDYREEWRP